MVIVKKRERMGVAMIESLRPYQDFFLIPFFSGKKFRGFTVFSAQPASS